MEIEIIPNWHPVFVHFTIGLLATSVALYLIATIVRKEGLHGQLATTARWTLWIGVLMTAATVLSGLDAYDTVPHHSTTQHLAMGYHRSWALGTAALFALLALWSVATYRRGRTAFSGLRHYAFVALLLTAGGMLAVTGYKGGELVYRHGIGVLAVPAPENGGRDHGHHDDHNNDH